MVKEKVAIVILNYNGWQDTIECLESVYQIDYPNYDVILVDNASSEDSIVKIKEYCDGKIKVESKFFEYNPNNKPIMVAEYEKNEFENCSIDPYFRNLPSNRKLILIKNDKNYGFAGGNNVGIRFAMKYLKPDYVLLLNNDTVVDRNLISELLKFETKVNRLGLVQPKIVNYDTLLIDNLGYSLNILGNSKPLNDIKSLKKLFYLSGACVLINKNLILEIDKDGNLFDDKLFAYFEDTDLSWRAHLLDYSLGICDNTNCYHKGSKTSNKINLNKYYLDYRNKLRVFIKNLSLPYLILYLFMSVLTKLIIVSIKSIINIDYRYLTSSTKAIMWNIEHLNDTIEQRIKVQSTRKVSDRVIVKRFRIIN
ncbi:MAG: glycosyltransferase family 2 protein [Dictyoglomus thermophilum]|nr:glycosyltransferase family 2 protein [Dictyoglomus thermophilum]MCX7721121.1 glycosyltransferase family 2 protein [Dictyoglomus thermophilum]